MKSYPSISTKIMEERVTMFDKLDGSNIRVEWSNKKGFYKFGSRTQLLDRSHPILGESIDLIMDKSDQLQSIFSEKKYERVVAFFEFHGENSFAGSREVELHKVTLIDVSVYKKGMMGPDEFIDMFSAVGIPRVLHEGVITENIITDIKEGAMPGMTFEGVVCKRVNPKNKTIDMFKIKNRAWIEKLKEKCDGNMDLFRRLV